MVLGLCFLDSKARECLPTWSRRRILVMLFLVLASIVEERSDLGDKFGGVSGPTANLANVIVYLKFTRTR